MTTLRVTAKFEAPIERVFELGTDFKRYPEWNVSYREVREVTGPVAPGTKIHTVTRILGRTLEGWGEIIEVDAPRLLKMRGTSVDGGHLDFEYRLSPKDAGTEVELVADYELPAGLFGQLFDRMFVERTVERDLKHSIENFKALVEARQPVLV